MADMRSSAPFGPAFGEALLLAVQVHGTQVKQVTGIPYVAHLLETCALVIQDGGDQDEAIAALLHDAAEDGGGEAMLATIRRRFGDRVAGIVDDCTDALDNPKPPWRARKETYLAHLPDLGRSSLRVSLADKLSNARAILAAHRGAGNGLADAPDGWGAERLWYYATLAEAFDRQFPGPMARELDGVVRELRGALGDGTPRAGR